jgi:DNA (cytosine-5)-methyltransferase 1
MAEELKDIPPGSGVKSQGKKERTRPGGHWGYKQGGFIADPNLPSRTITASGQQDWIRDPNLGLRRLCPRECAAIQTFPNEWRWEGRNSVRYRLIGNAVPPALSMAIGRALADHALTHASTQSINISTKPTDLAPLPANLMSAITYTMKEERSNGASRRIAPPRRTSRIELVDPLPQRGEG